MWGIAVFGSQTDEILFFWDKERLYWVEVARSFEGAWWSHLQLSNVIWDSDISQRYYWSLNSSVIWSCVIVLFPQSRYVRRNFETEGANKITQLYISEKFIVQIASFLHYGFCSNCIITYNAESLILNAVRDSNFNKIHPVIRLA